MPHRMNQRGVAAVEFALLLPVLIMVLFGIIEFGIALSRQQVLDTASREGARLGIRQVVPRPTAADIQAQARRVFTQAGVTGVVPTIAVTGAGGPSGTDLIVTVSAPYRFYVMANVIPALSGTVTLRSRTLMRHE
ncbi:MAG: TadE family protein [Nitrospira sp.]|jgi:Flp pilus assembly protein TadG|nr:pilus assembly protein [Nitrospira sp.]MBK7488213.1 pilus assembly protein [Nitrospira sp.]MBP7361230.1 pilus assembly protein [Nitrospira sp.]MBP8199682.1 pilus assembly protein [Nitrospira sp.]MBP9634625.1 pilus assembly protein [Nitrospira sp.]